MGNLDPEVKYKEILVKNGILDQVSKVTVSVPDDLVGEHFGSIVEYVTVQFEDKAVEYLHLFIKKQLPMPDPVMYELFQRVMLKEGFFLTTLVQDLKNLCIERLGDASLARQIEEMFPKTYDADVHAITMENITKRGFKMVHNDEMQDFHHAESVLTSLGRFHGLSHVRILESGGSVNYLAKNPHLFSMFHDPATEPIMSGMFSSPLKMLFAMLKESSQPGSTELLLKLKQYEGKSFTIMLELMSRESVFPVVNHGDAWNNNMMFCAGKDGQEPRVIMFDLQGSAIGAPSSDLGRYIYNSLKSEVRQQWRPLLQIYFDALKETVELFGVDFKFTFEELIEEFRTVGKVGVLTGLIVIVGLAAMKSHDTENSGFVISDPEAFDKLITSYIAQNKDKVEGLVSRVISLISDFELAGGRM